MSLLGARRMPSGLHVMPSSRARHVQRLAVEAGALGDEAHLRVARGVEEVAGAQVCVALGQLGVQAAGLDRQLDGRRGAQIQRPLVVGEVALDGHQPVEVTHVEGDARTRRVKPPRAIDD
jgi:hypothetical protein